MLQKSSAKLIDTRKKLNLEGTSLHIFSRTNRFREILSKIVVHELFEMFIFAVVTVSSILMIYEDPLSDPESETLYHIWIVGSIITFIFIIELIMKVIVFGLIKNGSNSYLQNGWNILDSVIVCISIASLIIETNFENNQAAANLQLFKMLRVLRSLRVISKSEGLKLSVLSLIYSLPGIINVTVVTMLFYLLFGIFFLNMLRGKFYYCQYAE